jgi:hypothetical protein
VVPPPPNLFPHPNFTATSLHDLAYSHPDSEVVFPSANNALALVPHPGGHMPSPLTYPGSEYLHGEYGDFAPTTTAGVMAGAAGANFQLVKKKKKKVSVKTMGEGGVGCVLSEKDQARKERHRMYMRKWREKRKSEGLALY